MKVGFIERHVGAAVAGALGHARAGMPHKVDFHRCASGSQAARRSGAKRRQNIKRAVLMHRSPPAIIDAALSFGHAHEAGWL
jgi:hypothetical protein